MLSDSISEGPIFQIFPDPLAIDLVLFNQICINCFAMCMLFWNSRSNKPLKVPSDSISEGLIFQNFLGHAPRPPIDLVLFNQIYIIFLQCACCLGISRRINKPLKVPSDSISEGLIFHGGACPQIWHAIRTQLSCSLQCICAPPFCESWIRPCNTKTLPRNLSTK